MSTQLPRSAEFALWFTAWIQGSVSLDDARDAMIGSDAGHDVSGLPGHTEPVPLILALGGLRSAGATGAGIALPVPGDPLGLAGPQDFNAEVIEAGEGVVLDGANLGLVPAHAGSGVVWRCYAAVSRRQVPDLFEADTCLRAALLTAANTLADLDVARWRPEVADELMALRRTMDFNLPAGLSPRAVRLASLSARCRTIVDLALDSEGSTVTAREENQRRHALVPLDRAARRGLVAVCADPRGR